MSFFLKKEIIRILLLVTFLAYVAIPWDRAVAASPITGTFISFPWNNNAHFTLANWQKEFDDMQAIGISILIIGGAVNKGYAANTTVAYYPSATYPSNAQPTLDHIFQLADQRGVRVYVSPADLANYWTTPELMAEFVALSKSAANEIKTRYGSRPSFTGWYVQPEYFLNTGGDSTPHAALASYYKSLTPGKKVLTAPYFIPPCSPGRIRCENPWWPNQTPSQIANNAKTFLLQTGIDILAVQDGVGASGVTMAELDAFLPAMKQAVTSIGREFWVDAEAFRYNANRTQFIPPTAADFVQQLDHESGNTIVLWIFRQFLSPTFNTTAGSLYQDFAAYSSVPAFCQPKYYLRTDTRACAATTALYHQTTSVQCGLLNPPTCAMNLASVLPGKTTGVCFDSLSACQSANATPTPTRPPTGTPTPTLPAKRGDLNNDNKVDIFDYNILLGHFGRTGTAGFVVSDIDKTGKVDIFDYNILLGGFGK